MTDDLDRELRSHLENEADEQRGRGLSAEDAQYAARRALGSEAIVREDVRALSPWAALDDAAQDLRYGLRLLKKNPSFAIVAALTLALGVGATTTIFSVVHAVLMRPLPYADADRLAMVWENVNLPQYKNAQNAPAPGNFSDWRDRSSTFVDMAAARDGAWSLTGSGDPIRVSGEMVSASLFRLLQVEPALGRSFTAEEDRAAPSRVVLLGHGLWVDRFGSNPSIVGQTIHLNDEPYVVVGVMPGGFRFPDPDDQLWVPLGLTPAQLANHGSHFLRVLGRLKPGVTIAQAQADLDTVAARLSKESPQTNTGVGVTVLSLPEQIVGDVRRPLLVLLGIVGFLLLMVCANIGNLTLARALARGREFAVRAALGASRTRLLRQLLAESILLATVGGALGLAIAWWGVAALRWLAPADLPRLDDIGVNGSVAAFNAAVALAAGVICGVMPALQSQRHDLHGALKDDSRASSRGARLRARNLLVIVETALGVVVLVGAGLLLRSFVRLSQVPLGFNPNGTLTFRVVLPAARYRTEPQRTAFYHQLLERLQALPGVQSAAGITAVPLAATGRMTGVSVEGQPPALGNVRLVDFRTVSPGYFGAMSIPLIAGRDVSWSDTNTTEASIVVSETMARTFWPDQQAIGKRIKAGRPEDNTVPWLTVVGIVADVRQVDLIHVPRPAMYVPASQDRATGDVLRDWIVRASGDPTALVPAIRSAVWSIDATLPIARVQTMNQARSASTASQQFTLLLVGLFALLALVLAAVGLYGVASYNVSQRTRELGIRVALGAHRGALLRLVLAHGARLTLIGLAVGTIAALALTQVMSTLLFGVGARDPMTFVGVALLLLAVIARRVVRARPSRDPGRSRSRAQDVTLFRRDRGLSAIVAAKVDNGMRVRTPDDFGARRSAPGTHDASRVRPFCHQKTPCTPLDSPTVMEGTRIDELIRLSAVKCAALTRSVQVG
jgi:putative ABC transport system permease protein